ncbi:uncharacterized protein LOC131256608 [Magnolia sinica]|uniref:uncharacterized protein LOC131256608 n=1 Tax=Magnolia sinica TaxID=86752 RepID=UPI002658CE27|nr:uncharacterized protein LOC131256608 [Magnolia sinica]
MKRKDLEEASDESSDFPFSSPARKTLRLDAEMPPIMEQEAVNPLGFDQLLPEEHLMGSTQQSVAPMEVAVPSLPSNKEMALVVYKPFNNPLLQPMKSPNLSFRVNTDLIRGLKNRVLWSGQPTVFITGQEEEEVPNHEKPAATSDCLAVTPWVPSQLPETQGVEDSAMDDGLSEPMEAEEVGMEVEETNVASSEGQEITVAAGMGGGEGLQQWQQQQCITPQILQNMSTPITWSW